MGYEAEMKRITDIEAISFADHISLPHGADIMYPFAWEEVHGKRVGLGQPPIIHLWSHPGAFVLGLRDRRLPYAREAMGWLETMGLSVAVRNSGGAAVPLDSGVLNVSLILPNPQGQIQVMQDFQMMVQWIRASISRKIHDGEIAGSFCPGKFDLSIGGRKFSGMAQRRQTKAMIIQAFVIVEGRGDQRAELVREFYARASGGVKEAEFPDIKPEVMASLQELAGVASVASYAKSLMEAFIASTNLSFGGRLRPLREETSLAEEIQESMVILKERYGG